jgi:hypothetical protein
MRTLRPSYTEAAGKRPMGGSDDSAQGFPFAACSSILHRPPLACVSQPKVPITSRIYLFTNIHVNR